MLQRAMLSLCITSQRRAGQLEWLCRTAKGCVPKCLARESLLPHWSYPSSWQGWQGWQLCPAGTASMCLHLFQVTGSPSRDSLLSVLLQKNRRAKEGWAQLHLKEQSLCSQRTVFAARHDPRTWLLKVQKPFIRENLSFHLFPLLFLLSSYTRTV